MQINMAFLPDQSFCVKWQKLCSVNVREMQLQLLELTSPILLPNVALSFVHDIIRELYINMQGRRTQKL